MRQKGDSGFWLTSIPDSVHKEAGRNLVLNLPVQESLVSLETPGFCISPSTSTLAA